MKTTLQQSIRISFLLLMSLSARAQEWTFGPKIALNLSVRTSPAELRNNDVTAYLGNNAGDASGSGLGLFARYDRPRWYGQVEVNRLRSRALNYWVESPSQGFSGGNAFTRHDFRLIGGYKPLPWLRINAGLVDIRNNAPTDNWYQNSVDGRLQQAEQFPHMRESFLSQARAFETAGAIENSVQRTGLEGTVGLGVDIGGLTVDLTHNIGLTPILDGVRVGNQTLAARQTSNFWALQIGYRLFPLKAHLLAPRKNRAYERLKRDIPFYRNEFHVAFGLVGEDIGSTFLYENRYTRYFTRRFGITGGLNLMRTFETYDNGFLPKQYTQARLITGLRVLPLYSRRHTIGLSVGPTLSYESGFYVSSGGERRLPNGQVLKTVNFSDYSSLNRFFLDVQATLDYNFAATDRIVIGPWLRATTDYGYFGFQAGYRF